VVSWEGAKTWVGKLDLERYVDIEVLLAMGALVDGVERNLRAQLEIASGLGFRVW